MVVNYQFKELKHEFYKFMYNGLNSKVPGFPASVNDPWSAQVWSGMLADLSATLWGMIRVIWPGELCGEWRWQVADKHQGWNIYIKYIFYTPLGFVVMFHPLREWFPSFFSGCKTIRRTVKDWDRGSTTFLAQLWCSSITSSWFQENPELGPF